MKPPFAYFGGKTVLAPRIVELLPPHEHYVEPYAGSLAVLLAKPRSPMETVSDLDGDLVHFWRILRDRPDELIRACALTPHSRAEQRSAYEPCDDDLERARRVWVVLSQGRGGTLRASKAGWRHFVKPHSRMSDFLDAYVDRMAADAERLHGVSLENLPALDLITKYGAEPGVCLYVDPPYLGETRPLTWDAYRHEMRSADDHREMLAALTGCKAAVVLSGYRSDLYAEELDGWDSIEFAAVSGHGSEHPELRSRQRVEVIWSNRPLHEPRLFTQEASA